jgi:sugar porter (SP) family MFS transporter
VNESLNSIKSDSIDQYEGKAGFWYVYLVSLVAAVGGFLFGYDLSIISGSIIFLEKVFELDPNMKGFVVSSAVFGCIIGPVSGLWLTDTLGRKRTLMVASVCFMVSAAGSALAKGLIDFVIWRAVGGIGVGLAAVVSPMYIAEMSPARLRGVLVTVNQLSIVIGINLSVIVSYILSFGEHWRWMFASEVIPILILMIGLAFVPRSPRWLVAKKKNDEALEVLTKINGRSQAGKELGEINAELMEETGTFKELFLPGIRLAVIIGVVLMVFQQINGVNAILFYAPSILIDAGIGSETNAIFNSIFVYLWILICTIIAFWFVKKFGRRQILIVGVSGMAIGHILLGLAFIYNLKPIYMLFAMFIGTGSFTLSLAPLGWVIVSEIFPNRIRGKAMSVVCFCLYTSSYFFNWAFPVLLDKFEKSFGSRGGAYWIFAGICFACVIFTFKMIPETKDLTLEEIGRFWLKYDNKKRLNR